MGTRKLKTKPKININWDEVGKLLEAGSSGVEVAAYLGFSEQALYLRCRQDLDKEFSALKQEKRARGDALLRGKQYATAMKGNVPMQIFLGKNRLGQADKVDQRMTGTFTTETKIILPEPEPEKAEDAD